MYSQFPAWEAILGCLGCEFELTMEMKNRLLRFAGVPRWALVVAAFFPQDVATIHQLYIVNPHAFSSHPGSGGVTWYPNLFTE